MLSIFVVLLSIKGVVLQIEKCSSVTWNDTQMNMSIFFPENEKGSLVYSTNRCPDGRPVASRMCSKDLKSKFTTYPCFKDSNEIFNNVKYFAIRPSSINEFGLATKSIQSRDQLIKATSALRTVVRLLPSSIQFARSTGILGSLISTDDIYTNVFNGFNNVIDTNAFLPSFNEYPSITNDLRESLNTVAFSNTFDLQNPISLPNFSLQEISPTFISEDSQSYADLHFTDQLTSNATFSNSERDTSPLSVTIPGSVLDSLSQNINTSVNDQPLSVKFLLFHGDELFPSMYQPRQVLSINAIPMTKHNFSKPITLVYNESKISIHSKNPLKRIISKMDCGSWVNGYWSLSVCNLVENKSTPTCQCYSFGTFTLLVSTDEVLVNVSLTVISTVGMAIAVILLMITLFNLLFVPQLRRHKTSYVNINICSNVICLYLLTTFGVGAVNFTGCSFIAALIQFELLCSWFWISINSYRMFEDLSRIFGGSKVTKLKMIVIGYICPLVIVIINVSVTIFYLDKKYPLFNIEGDLISRYTSSRMCWLHSYSLSMGVLLPIGLLLIFNIGLFILVIRSLSTRFAEIQSLSEKRAGWQQLGTAVLIGSTMGLSWIFVYLMLISPDLVYQTIMSSLFTFFVILQSCVMFYLNCFRYRKVVFKWVTSIGTHSTTPTSM